MALHTLAPAEAFRVVTLLTTVTETYDRIAMHGVRRELLRQQAESIACRCTSFIPPNVSIPSTNRAWKKPSASSTTKASAKSPCDIFPGRPPPLPREKPRPHRHDPPLFPIWKRDTRELIHFFTSNISAPSPLASTQGLAQLRWPRTRRILLP